MYTAVVLGAGMLGIKLFAVPRWSDFAVARKVWFVFGYAALAAGLFIFSYRSYLIDEREKRGELEESQRP